MRRSPSSPPPSRAGFTLIELLIVLLLMLVLSLFAVPEVLSSLRRAQVDSGTRAVQMVTARARQGAVSHQSRVAVLTGQTAAGANGDGELYLLAYALDTTSVPLQLEMRQLPKLVLEGPPAQPKSTVDLTSIDTSSWPTVQSPHGPLTLASEGMLFLPNGSVQQAGAWRLAHENQKTFRLSDGTRRLERFDYRELAVAIPATGRLVLNRWNRDTETFERARPAVQ